MALRFALLAARAVLVVVLLACATADTSAEPDAKQPAKHPANRLAKQSSPYLLLHAHNPVDWYPWGDEALAKAKRENKLIFLSVGYSSCYWCHVMERQSFMDEEIAALMNKHFVAIKVDREERPDIDDIYMTALQAMNQRGGWPMSMFLTPAAEPIVGGTYYPPRDKEGQRGFLTVLGLIQDAWEKQPEAMQKQGQQVAEHLRQQMRQRPAVLGKLRAQMADGLLEELSGDYDAEHGGFGYSKDQPKQPKFPQPSNLVFLLDRVQRLPEQERARAMLLHSLEEMAQGGIRDHIGGGFHRYSTDRFWRVPHFEKMLYDNGQLASLYAEAFALTERTEFRHVTEEILEFVLRELTDPQGGFYCALDAETDAEEGRFYVWTTEELKDALTAPQFALMAAMYGVQDGPNFEGRYVLQLARPLAQIAEQRGLTIDQLTAELAPIRAKLLERRAKRERPLTDTKILTSWNGLMIKGLADSGRILKNERYTAAAVRAADFLLAKLRGPDGRLKHAYSGGEATLNAYVDDYAFLADGLIALHRATGDARWLKAAAELTDKQIELFWDERGGFYFTSHDHETLIVRSKNPVDGAIPSGNSVAASNLLYLATALDRPAYRDRCEKTLQASSTLLERSSMAVARLSTVLSQFLAEQPAAK